MKKGLFVTLLLTIFISPVIFDSCKPGQAATDNSPEKLSGPQILFISYKYNGEDLQLESKTVTAGKFKSRPQHHETKVNGDLILVQLNKDKLVLDGMHIPNPRIRVVEYADESGMMQKKTVEVENAEFTARINLHSDTKFIMVKEYNDASTELLIMNITELD